MLIITTAVVVVAAIIIAVAMDQSRGDAPRGAATSGSASDVTSPYDLTEISGDLDLDILEDTSFISILILNAEGQLTSYMADADGAAATALIKAVRGAEQVNSRELTGSSTTVMTTGGETIAGTTPTLTFVLPTHQTVTFSLDLDHGLLWRRGGAWMPEGDLRTLIGAAITAPPE
jgi:hypothetical protein